MKMFTELLKILFQANTIMYLFGKLKKPKQTGL